MTTQMLQYQDVLRGAAAVHIARAQVTPARPKALHSQNFYQLFWVQNGTVRHHLADGVTTLSEGALAFVRPNDRHALQGRGDDVLVVSLALLPSLVDALGKRHKVLQGQLFWASAMRILHLDSTALIALNQAAMRLERTDLDSFSVEAFLLPLCAELLLPDTPVDAPVWLTDAIFAATNPTVFRAGAAGFVAQTGQTHPHVSRTMKRVMGISPSEFINQQRMTFAARQLTSTSETLADIASDCGIPNLSHFHKLFRVTHGLTPHQFRRKYQRDVVQPE